MPQSFENSLKAIKDILDTTISAERRCYEIIHFLLLKENQRYQSQTLEVVTRVLKKLENSSPLEVIEELECEYDKRNLG